MYTVYTEIDVARRRQEKRNETFFLPQKPTAAAVAGFLSPVPKGNSLREQ